MMTTHPHCPIIAVLDHRITLTLRVFCAQVIARCYGEMHHKQQDRWGN